MTVSELDMNVVPKRTNWNGWSFPH